MLEPMKPVDVEVVHHEEEYNLSRNGHRSDQRDSLEGGNLLNKVNHTENHNTHNVTLNNGVPHKVIEESRAEELLPGCIWSRALQDNQYDGT